MAFYVVGSPDIAARMRRSFGARDAVSRFRGLGVGLSKGQGALRGGSDPFRKFDVTLFVNDEFVKIKEVTKYTVRDMRILRKQLDDKYVQDSSRLFATQGGSGGRNWKKLKRSYERRKLQKHPGAMGILRATDELRDSFSDSNDPFHIAIVHKDSDSRLVFFFGSNHPRAAYHSSNPGRNKNLPIRDPGQRTVGQLRGYAKVIGDHWAEKWRRKLKSARRFMQNLKRGGNPANSRV